MRAAPRSKVFSRNIFGGLQPKVFSPLRGKLSRIAGSTPELACSAKVTKRVTRANRAVNKSVAFGEAGSSSRYTRRCSPYGRARQAPLTKGTFLALRSKAWPCSAKV